MSSKSALSTHINPLLDKRIVQAFADAVINTLTTMAKINPKLDKPFVHQRYRTRGVVAGLIGMVSGAAKGQLTLAFEKEAALHVVNSLIAENHTELNDAILDGIGELTNIVYGVAKTVLNERGYAFQMAIPMVIEGHDAVIPMHSGTTLVLPFLLEDSKFYVEIVVQA
jgi:chemotaxis protein CheX